MIQARWRIWAYFSVNCPALGFALSCSRHVKLFLLCWQSFYRGYWGSRGKTRFLTSAASLNGRLVGSHSTHPLPWVRICYGTINHGSRNSDISMTSVSDGHQTPLIQSDLILWVSLLFIIINIIVIWHTYRSWNHCLSIWLSTHELPFLFRDIATLAPHAMLRLSAFTLVSA